MKTPTFNDVIYIVDDGTDSDVVAGYYVDELVDENEEELEDGRHVAVYKLSAVKRFRTTPRLE